MGRSVPLFDLSPSLRLSRRIIKPFSYVQEFKDGHVKGAIQWETIKFQDPSQVDALIDGPLKGKSKVIVHCMLSQQRGPLCAGKLLERLQERGIVGPEVKVMAGGWDRFSTLYGTSEELVEAETAKTDK